MLKKDFKFIKAFDKLDKEKFGASKAKVEYFGITPKSESDLRDTVDVLFYNNKNDFALAVKTEGNDVLYFYRTDDDKTFDAYYSDMKLKGDSYKGETEFGQKDALKVPNIDMYKLQAFKELENKQIKHTDMKIGTAVETVQFKMNNEGVKLKSEAVIMMKATALRPEPSHPRHFYLNDTFVIFLQEADKTKPYFE